MTWKDQGWGNRKASAQLSIMRGKKTVLEMEPFGITGHKWTTVDWTAPQSVLAKYKQGDDISVRFKVGGGGG